ncbi:MAG TPA: tryptophan--tRNA ligase [Ktedonobacterales bacterium]|jgi:tryptophanyl-tRNA synthetase|nr:tryptophan--tRNA ligase [Ktedonobacterales bacterium]
MSASPTSTKPVRATEPTSTRRERVFSGIQPSGSITIGNYLGAMRHWAADQDQYDNIYCIVDLHAITVPQDPTQLRQQRHELAAILFAVGLDPERSAVFAQSHVHEHAELAWILGCITTIGQLNRMTQFKIKAGDQREEASAGLFTYPVLMAADILLYQADAVPVGEDQRQHVELTRDIAERFNYRFGPTFVVPRPLIREVGGRIMALDDPSKKMSKSGAESSYIALLDPPDVIRKKIARATTDSRRTIVFDESRPGIYNLLTIHQLLGGESRAAIEREFEGKGYKEFKAALTERTIATLAPIQRRYAELAADPAELDRLLALGAAKVRPLAHATLTDAMRKVGYD